MQGDNKQQPLYLKLCAKMNSDQKRQKEGLLFSQGTDNLLWYERKKKKSTDKIWLFCELCQLKVKTGMIILGGKDT